MDRAPVAIRDFAGFASSRASASSCAHKPLPNAATATNALAPINRFDCTENKRDTPCQEFGRNVMAHFLPDFFCQEKRFFESTNALSRAQQSCDSSSTFQRLPAAVAPGILVATPSSEYSTNNRLQQSHHRNPFFRCAPFNCDYTQP